MQRILARDRMWFQVKLTAAATAIAALAAGGVLGGRAAGTGAGGATSAESVREATDFAGRTWRLDATWREGERPYRQELGEREGEYRKRWGENWAGDFDWNMGEGRQVIVTPGAWDFEEVAIIPDGVKLSPQFVSTPRRGGQVQTLSFSGNDSDATDLFVLGRLGAYHLDLATKSLAFIGDETLLRKVAAEPHRIVAGGILKLADDAFPIPPGRDGMDGGARLFPYDAHRIPTVDPITGRVFFSEPTRRGSGGGNAFRGPHALRTIEKLLPYKMNGEERLLPAILEHNQLYRKIGAEPVLKDGRRAAPRFAVRTLSVQGALTPVFGAWGSWGARVVLSADGRRILVGGSGSDLDVVALATGEKTGTLAYARTPLPASGKQNVHGGSCGRFDNWFYLCTAQGTGPSPGLLFRVALADGRAETLYDSFTPRSARGENRRAAGMWDGPADAISLTFASTRYQTQCPRTGAIFNSGWDGSGLRRYHDGFVTTLAGGSFAPHRPDWKDKPAPCAAFGNRATPCLAPNGDLYLDCAIYPGSRHAARSWPEWGMESPERTQLLVNGIRIMRIFRKDWPAQQPVAGYWNRHVSPEQREALRLDYVRDYIARYAELSLPEKAE